VLTSQVPDSEVGHAALSARFGKVDSSPAGH
jgi:hypothetical protein